MHHLAKLLFELIPGEQHDVNSKVGTVVVAVFGNDASASRSAVALIFKVSGSFQVGRELELQRIVLTVRAKLRESNSELSRLLLPVPAPNIHVISPSYPVLCAGWGSQTTGSFIPTPESPTRPTVRAGGHRKRASSSALSRRVFMVESGSRCRVLLPRTPASRAMRDVAWVKAR